MRKPSAPPGSATYCIRVRHRSPKSSPGTGSIELGEGINHPLAADQQVRCDLGEGHQHEGALTHVSVREHETLVGDGGAVVGQDVDVDDARAPSLRADPAERVLYRQARVEKSVRIEIRLHR